MIKGWIEGLKFLKEGGKIELYIPSELAYDDQGRGQLIPPGATLIFEVELLEVK
jgi:FKBP-type peptidyl-prolyl cis-trans isomerase